MSGNMRGECCANNYSFAGWFSTHRFFFYVWAILAYFKLPWGNSFKFKFCSQIKNIFALLEGQQEWKRIMHCAQLGSSCKWRQSPFCFTFSKSTNEKFSPPSWPPFIGRGGSRFHALLPFLMNLANVSHTTLWWSPLCLLTLNVAVAVTVVGSFTKTLGIIFIWFVYTLFICI